MTAALEPGPVEQPEEEVDVVDALAGTGRPGPWVSLARCQTVPPAVFFPEPQKGPGRPEAGRDDDVDRAKKVCRLCPVVEECRSYAIDAGSALKGIWGGTSERERQLERRRRLAPVAAPADEVEPPSTQSPAGTLGAVLMLLRDAPDRWARVARYRSPQSASAMASRFRTGRLPKPAGLWSFEGRVNEETGGSDLYARYDGAEG